MNGMVGGGARGSYLQLRQATPQDDAQTVVAVLVACTQVRAFTEHGTCTTITEVAICIEQGEAAPATSQASALSLSMTFASKSRGVLPVCL
jgi:hypothetical protein